jgi:hypothetical protein
VPNDITVSLQTTAVTVTTPGPQGIQGPAGADGAGTTTATDAVTGTVKTDVTEADPLVYTKATTDTLLAAKATAAGLTSEAATRAAADAALDTRVDALEANPGGVASFNGRTGAVVPAADDYAVADITGLATALAGKADDADVTGEASTRAAADAALDTRVDALELAPPAHTHTLSEVTDAGTAASKNAPASGNAASGEVVLGSDTRLTDARTPTAHTHTLSQITDAGTAAALNVPASGNAASGEVVKGSDTRLTDSRAPNGTASGDLAGSYPSPTLGAVGTAGTYGDATHVPQITTDSKGRVTAVTAVAITGSGASAATSGALGTVKISGTPADAANPTVYVKEQADTLLAAKIAASLVDAKGDLLVGTANDTVARLAVGSDGKALVADSTQTGGLKYGGVLSHAYYTYKAAALEPLAIEALQRGTFSYVIGSSATKLMLGGWSFRLGTGGRMDLRDLREFLPLRNVTVTGAESQSLGMFVDPTLPTYTDARTTYYDRLATLATTAPKYLALTAPSAFHPLLPGPLWDHRRPHDNL